MTSDAEYPRYCPSCRIPYYGTTPAPPYAAMELLQDGMTRHVDPLTRDELIVYKLEVTDG